MIVKTADTVQRRMDQLSTKLTGEYVAASEFGTYVERLNAYLEANPEALTQYYSFFADLQASGYIDQFFVAPAFAGQGVARALMGHIHAQAAQRGIAQLHADVSLTAEPFFAACGFVVQARQQAQRQGVVLHNARMVKVLIM